MRLSAPIFRLKRAAKLLSREARIPLHDALDRIARSEGFNSWSHLSAAASHRTPVEMLYQSLAPGDVVLLGARPGHGKTLLALELLDEAIKEGRRGFFFTLEFSENDVADCIRAFNFDEALFRRLVVDTSDDIDADYMIARLAGSAAGALIVIDYLQLLDQKRTKPALAEQMARQGFCARGWRRHNRDFTSRPRFRPRSEAAAGYRRYPASKSARPRHLHEDMLPA